MRELLIFLGLAPYGGNYETVRRRIKGLGLGAPPTPEYMTGKRLRTCSLEELIEAVRTSRSLSQVLAKLGVRPGGNQGRLRTRIKELGLDTSHFTGQSWRRGSDIPVVPRRPLEEVLVAGRLSKTSKLKTRLIQAGLKAPRCESCNRDTWNGLPIPLELDHVNGRRDDNRLSNLRILCPNCHAQTPNYRGKNIGNADRVR
jgi:hypothetical protein